MTAKTEAHRAFGREALKTALTTNAQCACRLTSGEAIVFQGAETHGDWVHLQKIESTSPSKPLKPFGGPEVPFPNGLHVRLESIVWMAAEPFGPPDVT